MQKEQLGSGGIRQLAFLPEYKPSPTGLRVLRGGNMMDAEEAPQQLLERVTGTYFLAEPKFGTSLEKTARLEQQFAEYMVDGYIIPGTPALTNAGRRVDSGLSSCI